VAMIDYFSENNLFSKKGINMKLFGKFISDLLDLVAMNQPMN
jgi:hypothetical protein